MPTNDEKMLTNDKKMSLRTKLLISGAVILLAGVATFEMMSWGDSSIEVADGSIKFKSSAVITKKSKNQIEVSKALHKVKTIAIGDYGNPGSPIDVRGREWTLTSTNTPEFLLSLRTQTADLGKTVVGTCTSDTGWTTPDGLAYTCVPTPTETKLTPVTLTFSDGDCPGTQAPSCTLTCQSGMCDLILTY